MLAMMFSGWILCLYKIEWNGQGNNFMNDFVKVSI